MTKFEASKFSFAEMTSNRSGKTSASGTMGALLVVIGGFTFMMSATLYWVFDKEVNDILIQSIALCYAGATLLGYRKSRESVESYSQEQSGDVYIPNQSSSYQSETYESEEVIPEEDREPVETKQPKKRVPKKKPSQN